MHSIPFHILANPKFYKRFRQAQRLTLSLKSLPVLTHCNKRIILGAREDPQFASLKRSTSTIPITSSLAVPTTSLASRETSAVALLFCLPLRSFGRRTASVTTFPRSQIPPSHFEPESWGPLRQDLLSHERWNLEPPNPNENISSNSRTPAVPGANWHSTRGCPP
jgi:hypothetical protein